MADTNTIQGLHQRAEEIRYAHLSQDPEGSNSDERVGSLLVDIVDLLGSGSGDLGTFLSTLNSSSALNDATPGSGQTIVYNGAWGFGDAGGGGGSFTQGSILSSLLSNGGTPGNADQYGNPTISGYIIKWNGTKWIYAPDESGGQGTGDFTKTLFMASKWWGSSPTAIYNTQSELVGYRIKGNIIGSKENGDPDNIPLLNSIEFGNGIKLIASTDNGAYNLHIEGPTTQAEGQDPVTHVANFYATGGVSALGNSSGGGGGGGGLTSGHWAEFFDGIIHPSGTESGKNGKYLMLTVDGSDNVSLSWTTPAGSLPSMTEHEGDYLKVINNGGTLEAAWTSASPGGGLTPGNLAEALDAVSAPTSASTDKYLKFNGSTYVWDNPPSASGGITSVTLAGDGNAVTTATVSGSTLTLTKGTIFLTQHQDISGKLDKSTFETSTWWRRSFPVGSTEINGSITNVPLPTEQNPNPPVVGGDVKGFNGVSLFGTSNCGYGGYIDFHYEDNTPSANYTSRLIENTAGTLSLLHDSNIQSGGLIIGSTANDYIQIGAVKIVCEANNTLKIIGADGYAGHLYATGGISALGLSSGSSPSIGNLTVTDKLTLQSTDNTKGLTFTDGTNTTPLYMNDGNLTVGGSGISFGSGVYANTSGFHATNLYATRVYLQTDPNDVYLYWHVEENNNRLRLVVGTTEYDISTSQVPTS